MENTRELLMKIEQVIEVHAGNITSDNDLFDLALKDYGSEIWRAVNLHEALSKVLRAKER